MSHKFILFFALLCCSAFFSASETALFSLSRLQIYRFRNQVSRAAHLVVKCLREPRKWLATILLGNELTNVLISIIGASIVNSFFSYDVKIQTLIAVAIITPIILLFGEVIPKNLAIRHSYGLAPVLVIPLRLFYQIITPFRVLLANLADKVVLVLGGHPENSHPMIMEEEFRRLVDLGSRAGVIIEEERKMIHNVFEFSDKTVRNLMTPKDRIFMLYADLPYEKILSEIKTTQFSRIPICEENPDNIIGILHVRDLFAFDRKRKPDQKDDIRSILHEPPFISAMKKPEELLRDFQKAGVHMAIVKDGESVVGIITLDDVLEEIFGEIEK